MYVADTYNNRVQMFEMPETTEPPPAGADSWTYSSQISAAGGRAPLYPAGIAIADADTWYVADSAGSRLVTVDPGSGTSPRSSAPALNDPRDVVLDSTTANRLWVLNTGENRVLKLSTTGSNQGSPITELNQPYGLAQDDGQRLRGEHLRERGPRLRQERHDHAAWTQTTCNSVAFSRPRDVAVAGRPDPRGRHRQRPDRAAQRHDRRLRHSFGDTGAARGSSSPRGR